MVEVKERRGRPILRNKQKACQRHWRGDERAPADLRSVLLSKKVAGHPGLPQNEYPDEIPIMTGDFYNESDR